MIISVISRLLLVITGLTWLLGFTTTVPLIASILPGTLLVAGGVASLLLRGDFRTPQLVTIGAAIGMITAVLLIFSISFYSFCWLFLLSIACFVVGGRGFEEQLPIPDVPASKNPLSLAGKAAIDELALGAVIRFMVRPPGQKALDDIAEQTDSAISVLKQGGFIDSPLSWHSDPVAPENLISSPASFRGLDYQRIKFTSGYQPPLEFPGFDRWQSFENNRSAHGIVLQHPGPPRPWIMCIHGGGMGSDMMNLVGMQAAKFHRDHGLNVVLPVLPLHGPRSTGKMNGVGLIGDHLTNTLFGLSQMAWDLRQILAWIRTQGDTEEGEPSIGVYGISLGGYSTALLTTLESELACAVAGIPANQLAPMILKLSEPRVAAGLAERGIGLGEIETLFRVISPLAMPPKIALDKRYMFAGIADRMVPANHVAELWRHWQQPRIEWYQGSHVSWLWESPAQNLLDEVVAKHLGG